MRVCLWLVLLSDSLNPRTFADMNECIDGTHRCEQICRNTPGSYTCSCNAGYILANDRHGCTSKTFNLIAPVTHQQFKPYYYACRHWWVCTGHWCLCSGLSWHRWILPVWVQSRIWSGPWWAYLQWYIIDIVYMGTMLSVLLCADIDECTLERDRCDQNCQNTVGNYTCSCRTGYTLSGRFTCLSKQKKKDWYYYLYFMWKTILYQILMSVPLALTSVIRLVQILRGPTPAGVSWGTRWMLMDAPAMVSCTAVASCRNLWMYTREPQKEACN